MKRIYSSFLTIFLLALSAMAQVPDAFQYQAVVRDSEGNLRSNENVNVEIGIIQGSAGGNAVYSENHSVTTDGNGVLTLMVGNGDPVSSDLSQVDWSNGPYFIEVTIDGTISVNAQLLSVPFAKYAENSGNVSIEGDNGERYNLQVDSTGNLYATKDCPSTVTDYDGNTYDVVKIGEQCWLAENLRVTHYADGTPIPKVPGDTDWDNLGISDQAYCWYENDSTSKFETYGALYTWAAAMKGAASSNSNPGTVQGVCPDGWHMPSGDEWNELESALGGGTNVGSQLADSAALWKDGDLVNNAEFGTSGFKGFPGGLRRPNGDFGRIENYTTWWSSREESATSVFTRNLYFGSSELSRFGGDMDYGFSVRCVKD